MPKTKKSKGNQKGEASAPAANPPKPPDGLPNNLLSHDDQGTESRRIDTTVMCEGSILVASNFLSATECRNWTEFVDGTLSSKASGSATNNNSGSRMTYTQHPASRTMAHRECFRYQCTDWNMADRLFARMQSTAILEVVTKHLEAGSSVSRRNGYKPVAANGNIRVYKYEKGMSFGRHIDEGNATERGTTEVTVLVYLSTCRKSGATRFYLPKPKRSSDETVLESLPEEGKILFHVHGDRCLEHEADEVASGDNIKYVLRTDLIYGF